MNSWDERYGTADYYYGTEANEFLREHCSGIRRGGDVLCLAEGEGRNAVFLAQQGFRPVAVDQSAVGLKKAEQLAANRSGNARCTRAAAITASARWCRSSPTGAGD